MPTFDAILDDDESLNLPIQCRDGVVRTYSIKEATALEWARISAGVRVVNAYLNKVEPDPQDRAEFPEDIRAMNRLFLGGDVADQMIADGVSQRHLQLATVAAQIWHNSGGDTERALAVWSGKGRKPKTHSDKVGDAAPTMKQPASGSGTQPHPVRFPKPKPAPRGLKSGGSGTTSKRTSNRSTALK